MDDLQALRIISALANGTNPVTGELFPADSPYQSPDIVRALFVAVRAIEARASRSPSQAKAGPQVPPSASSGNAGKPWSSDEDRELLAGFDAGKSLSELAQAHGRTQGGIRARLEKHGRLEPSPATRWPLKGKFSRDEPVRDMTR
jgi:hypothetical protein